jgi:hypothetical protein
MRVRFAAVLAAFGFAAAGLLSVGAQSGYASLVATTGTASSVTSTSATLNGVALTLSLTSEWVFEYGTSTAYGSYSHGSSVGLGLTALSQTVTGLAPDTTYHFRLVVVQGDPSNPSSYSDGADATFTTAPQAPPYGKASVPSHRLTVQHGFASVRILCSGARGSACKGKLALMARSKRGRLVSCGSGVLTASGGHREQVASQLDGACMSLLKNSSKHRVRGELKLTLSGAQKLLSTVVTLVGTTTRHGPLAKLA